MAYRDNQSLWRHPLTFTVGSGMPMFHGGMKQGYVHGVTAPERPPIAIENRVNVEDRHATIMTVIGISRRTAFEVVGRPFYATLDGKGESVDNLFA